MGGSWWNLNASRVLKCSDFDETAGGNMWEQISNWAHTKSGLHAKNLFCSYKSIPVSNPGLLTDYSLCTHSILLSKSTVLIHKGTRFPLFAFEKKKIKFLSACSHDSPVRYHIQAQITFFKFDLCLISQRTKILMEKKKSPSQRRRTRRKNQLQCSR